VAIPKPSSATGETGERSESRPAARRRAQRDHILELLDGAKARHEKAFAGADGAALHYFAHLSAIRQLSETLFARWLKPHRVSYSEYRVLSSLRTRGRDFRATPLELNQVAQITSAGMTRTLDRLEAAGYIEREPNPTDRRSVHIGLTRAGWSFASELARSLGEHYAEVLEGVTPRRLAEETKTLRHAVERLADEVTR